MNSIRDIYKIGYGPSSSHTMGPQKAALMFKSKHPEATIFRVTLYGSLAATGKGHLTDTAIINTLSPSRVEMIWEPEITLDFHPNAMKFEAIQENESIDSWIVYSIGGGDLSEGNTLIEGATIYTRNSMREVLTWCQQTGKTYWEYVFDHEENDIAEYLVKVWNMMKAAIERGLDAEGLLPGTLGLQRKASTYFVKSKGYQGSMKTRALLYSYALACSEENASGGLIVTAPTCGSCGVLPSVLYHLNKNHGFSETKIIRALATAGVIGSIVKTNASVSGAEVGCQGEIGVACAMAAGAATQLFGGSVQQIEYAAEMGLEHHLGLTCDPVCGYVQVPCIERNAFASARALDSCSYAMLSDGKHLVSFDKIIKTMKQTGHDIPSIYRETSIGGLAKYMHLNDDDIES